MVGERKRLTKSQRALLALMRAGMNPRHMTRADAARKGVASEFATARRARLIVSAGYESSGIADDFLTSPAGRRALAEDGGGDG